MTDIHALFYFVVVWIGSIFSSVQIFCQYRNSYSKYKTLWNRLILITAISSKESFCIETGPKISANSVLTWYIEFNTQVYGFQVLRQGHMNNHFPMIDTIRINENEPLILTGRI